MDLLAKIVWCVVYQLPVELLRSQLLLKLVPLCLFLRKRSGSRSPKKNLPSIRRRTTTREMAAQVVLTVVPDAFQLIPSVSEDCTIQITNISFVPVMFRLLTTTPSRYLVKSSRGVIQPCSSETVNISLHQHVEEKCSDDFKLEYCALSSTDVLDAKMNNVADLIKATPKEQVHKKLIKCKVVIPAGTATAPAAAAPLRTSSGSSSTSLQQSSGSGAGAATTLSMGSLPLTAGGKSSPTVGADAPGNFLLGGGGAGIKQPSRQDSPARQQQQLSSQQSATATSSEASAKQDHQRDDGTPRNPAAVLNSVTMTTKNPLLLYAAFVVLFAAIIAGIFFR